MDGHSTVDDFHRHLRTPDPRVERHVAACPSCREKLAFERMFVEALSASDVWEGAADMREAVAPEALHELHERLQSDREEAAELLAPVLRSIDTFRQAGVERNHRFQSAAVVHELTKAANTLRQNEPQFALIVASAATAIAGKLGPDVISQSTLGSAWLERGIACGSVGRYREADAALLRAEDAYVAEESGWDLANVWLSRANVCIETERLEEATELASRAADTYLAFCDRKRHPRALLVKSSAYFTRGMYRDGIDVYEQLLPLLDRETDAETYGTAQHTAAYCYVGLGQLDLAEALFVETLAKWDQLGLDSQRTRAAWGLATILVKRGDFESGLRSLDAVRRQFHVLGVVNDEALVCLEMAEVLLILGRPAEVRTLLKDIAVQFATEGMMRNARRALAYLSEAIEQERLTVAQVRHVRNYLEQLPIRSNQPFVPLA